MRTRPTCRPLVWAIFLLTATLFSTCSPQRTVESADFRAATKIALDWNKLLLELDQHTPGYRPPVSARMFAYIEMAAYEAALPAMKDYVSLENSCVGYHKPSLSTKNYHLPAALNAAYAQMARVFFPTASVELLDKVQRLEAQYATKIGPLAIQDAVEFGQKTAMAVWDYSAQDSLGHDGFMFNYDRNFKAKNDAGCWAPDEERPIPPLLPHWGGVRTFVVNTREVRVKPPIAYDETASSPYFSEALEVFSISRSLSSEERWIAEFWSDDIPGFTITPTGRWISIANQAIEKSSSPFPEVMETYLKTAMALCDAAVLCWDNKYKYQIERPEAFIRRNIQSDWAPLHQNPSFPSYPSGHAIFGAAAAEVLTAAFGADFPLIDYTHQGRQEFASKPRAFQSFDEMANENAYSRVLIGVHFRMDCEEGLRLGKIVGQKVNGLSLRKEQAAAFQAK